MQSYLWSKYGGKSNLPQGWGAHPLPNMLKKNIVTSGHRVERWSGTQGGALVSPCSSINHKGFNLC